MKTVSSNNIIGFGWTYNQRRKTNEQINDYQSTKTFKVELNKV